MAHASCAHCQTTISDHTTMVERGGQTYCCNNCAMMAEGQTPMHTGKATCAHCNSPIMDTSTQVERGGQTFCCNNCAMAVAQGAGHGTIGGLGRS